MNCSGDNSQDNECRTGFKDCSDSIEPDEESKWKGVDDVPGLNLDTLQDEGYPTCVLLFYNCSLSLDSCRREFSQCAQKNAVTSINEKQNTPKPSVTRTTTAKIAGTKTPNQKTPKPVENNKVKDVHTPSLEAGSGKIPESKFHDMSNSLEFIVYNSVQCTWSFFKCKKSSSECKKEHNDCLNGDVCKFLQSLLPFINLFEHF